MSRPLRGMRRYWDAAATRNAPWYVDTSLEYDAPDMSRFLETGSRIVKHAMIDAPITPEGRGVAVEIGSGLGRICLALADHFDEVIGIDISREMVRRAHELIDDPRVRFVVSDGATLAPLDDESVDFVLSFTVFQHIPDPTVVRSYVMEAGRVLRPGGVLAMQWNATPGAGRWRIRRTVRSAYGRLGFRSDRYGRDAPQFLGSRISIDRMRRWLTEAGLQLVDVRADTALFTWAWAGKRVR